MNLYNFPVSI